MELIAYGPRPEDKPAVPDFAILKDALAFRGELLSGPALKDELYVLMTRYLQP